MRSHRASLVTGSCIVLMLAISSPGCQRKDTAASDSASSRAATAAPDEVQTRRAQVEKVIAEHRASYDAFDSGSLGDAPAAFGNAALEATGSTTT
jgi:hypothetical protein